MTCAGKSDSCLFDDSERMDSVPTSESPGTEAFRRAVDSRRLFTLLREAWRRFPPFAGLETGAAGCRGVDRCISANLDFGTDRSSMGDREPERLGYVGVAGLLRELLDVRTRDACEGGIPASGIAMLGVRFNLYWVLPGELAGGVGIKSVAEGEK